MWLKIGWKSSVTILNNRASKYGPFTSVRDQSIQNGLLIAFGWIQFQISLYFTLSHITTWRVQKHQSPALNLIPPKVGERIVGFGHYDPEQSISVADDGTRHIEINGFGAATVGEVKEIHHERRDMVRLPFPCFQVNACFDGGTSGWPIFND